VLWIVDGIRPPGGEAPQVLDQWCPFMGDVTLLCTSRGARPLDVDVSIDLGSLSVSAAVDLIAGAGVRRDRLHPEEWAAIATWVGCVPQALQIQHAVLRSRFREPRDLLRAAQTKANPVGEIEAGFAELRSELPTGSMSGIAETFGIWYENLSNDRKLRDAAHLLARSVLPSGRLVARGLLAKLAIRSWVQTIERPDDSENAEPTWRMNDLVRSYLLARSPDPSLEVVRLACKYLGFGDPRTAMYGLPRGGLDLLANVKSLSPHSLEEIAHSVLERALSTPDDLDLAVVAELLGSLRDESARTRLAGALEDGTEILWPFKLYLRYVQGFARPPLEPKKIGQSGSTWTFAAESFSDEPLTNEQSVTLMAPFLAVLREAPLPAAIMAAKWMAEIPHTLRLVESELLRQVKASPDRASMLAGVIVGSEIKSAVACAVIGFTGEWLELEKRIDCLREAVKIDQSVFIAHVWLATLLAESQLLHAEETTIGQGTAIRFPAWRPGRRLDIESLSVTLPEDWAYELTRAEGRLGLIAHPRVATGPPPINLVIKSRTTTDTSLDEVVANYLRFMSGLAPLGDLSVRYVTERRKESFFVSFLISVENRRLRQVTRVLRDGEQEISATITHLETHWVEPENIEEILFSVAVRGR
jgi:hypothetical protein